MFAEGRPMAPKELAVVVGVAVVTMEIDSIDLR
jgi:hypothetical protein